MLVEAIKLAFIFFNIELDIISLLFFNLFLFSGFTMTIAYFQITPNIKCEKPIVTNGGDIVLIFLFRVKSVLTHCKRYDAEQNNIILCWGFSFFREKKLWFGHVASNYRWLIISIDGLRTLTEFNWTNRT